VIEAILVLGGIGALAALGLGVASVKFAVYVDPKVEEVEFQLPGVNCGACGFAGCHALAEAIAAGKAAPDACIPGGADVAARIADIMGLSAGKKERLLAVVHCKGVKGKAVDKGEYLGIPDCRAAMLILGSPKGCNFGCMGYGTCERACPFDAIHVNAQGIAEVDFDKCTACGKCVSACPKGIIDIRPAKFNVHIRCNNPFGGKTVKQLCSVGCIGCRRCEKTCPVDAIEMKRELAFIDTGKCVDCGMCAQVCPTSNIDDARAPRMTVEIDAAKCIGCTKCARACPVDVIAGEKKLPHVIDQEGCIGCLRCYDVCPVDAVMLGGERPKPGKGKVVDNKAEPNEGEVQA